MAIKAIGDDRYIFKFFHRFDFQRVLDKGPCSFANQLLVLKPIEEGQHLLSVDLKLVDFFVLIYNLPIIFLTRIIDEFPRNFIGQLLEVDMHYQGRDVWRNFLCVHVLIPVTEPFKRRKKLQHPNGELFWDYLRYERLPDFCFYCSMLDHVSRACGYLNKLASKMVWRHLRGSMVLVLMLWYFS